MEPEVMAVRAAGLALLLVVLLPVSLLLLPSEDLTGSLALRHCYASQRGARLEVPAPCRSAWSQVGTPARWFCPEHGFVDRPPGLGPDGNAWMDAPGSDRPVTLPSPREQLAALGITEPGALARASARRPRVVMGPAGGEAWVSPEARGLALYPLGFLGVLACLRLLGRVAAALQGGDRPPPATLEEAIERHAPELGAAPAKEPSAAELLARAGRTTEP